MKYFFILGRNPTLSVAEIIAFLTKQKISHHVEVVGREVLTIKTEEALPDSILEKLGGVVKFGSIIAEMLLSEKASAFEHILSVDFLLPHLPAYSPGKIHLGISLYDAGAHPKDVAQFSSQLKYLNKTIKANLQEKGKTVGFVQIKERFLTSVSVVRNELLTHGIEIVFMLGKETLIVGKTRAVQAFGSFSFRDMERPAKDKKAGILPPKLARMMINLTSQGPEKVLLDPFCGSGTIVTEALLLGFSSVLGSDISSQAVEGTQKNIDWLKNRFSSLLRETANTQVFQADIHAITDKVDPSSIDVVVTEPYLGPPLFQKPDHRMAEKILRDITPLYQNIFFQLKKVLKKRGRITIVFPCFEVNGKISLLEIEDTIRGSGFQIIPLLPKDIVLPLFKEYTLRGSIIYGGKEQFVRREIRCFELS